jgi:hypothetical protein
MIGKALPDIGEKYDNQQVDIIFFGISHNWFTKGIPKAKVSSVTIDKKGGIKLTLNIPATLEVKNKAKGKGWFNDMDGHEHWQPARNFYITLVVKIGVTQKDDVFGFSLKKAEMTNLIVMKPVGKEKILTEMP